ncbi:fibronectin type III domain-containing protein [Muricauda sp. 334s03]|uniref:Fibronectin type III domain-containing protein n=1 Tax=Flagellimonas yonaguniensis TaxID=3031325 RepID=A0ABT5Y4E2_9FLAO|nr:fibronectin type III domain-containing protein [[Muricauda] yonaguniensis]MDF0718255.1 fibronectin type III domain-containing protein [[Muricauda] yonaguniensis]
MNSKNPLFKFTILFIALLTIFSCTSEGVESEEPVTKGFAVVNTLPVGIDHNSGTMANAGGKIVSSDSPITNRGVCWSTGPNPTINDSKTEDGTGIGEFLSDMTGLEPNTRYYFRAYATNSAGTSYGGEIDFFTSKIYRGDVYLPSQENVDNFGAEDYLIVVGNLNIGKEGGSDITNLRALSNLNQVGGDLNIGGYVSGYGVLENPLLESLEGLGYLASVDTYYLNDYIPKDLSIGYCPKLENLDELNLFIFEGDITIEYNDGLQNIDGLARITKAEAIHIRNNASLTNLDGLSNIENITYIQLSRNPVLSDIGGIQISNVVLGGLMISENDILADLSVFSDITAISYDLDITDSPAIVDLTPFSKLTHIGRMLHITNTGVTNLDAFASLEVVGGSYETYSEPELKINDNDKLVNVCGLLNLFETDFPGEYQIYRNALRSNVTKEEILDGDCAEE